jgi:hypothetical protein
MLQREIFSRIERTALLGAGKNDAWCIIESIPGKYKGHVFQYLPYLPCAFNKQFNNENIYDTIRM